jgi:hypothetical protein
VLCGASDAFMAMFSNQRFVEANFAPEHPILFQDFDGQVGEFALR